MEDNSKQQRREDVGAYRCGVCGVVHEDWHPCPDPLDETSLGLRDALAEGLKGVFGTDVAVGPYHTGGGVMVLEADLSQDGRQMGRTLWLTREDGWHLGFYDHSLQGLADGYDNEGVVVSLMIGNPEDPAQIVAAIVGILTRLGVRTLA